MLMVKVKLLESLLTERSQESWLMGFMSGTMGGRKHLKSLNIK
jgi:hypothetical protein